MRHQRQKNKLAISPSHRKSLMRNLEIELIDHSQIETTQAKCKALRGPIEKLITLAKNDTVHNRRIAFKKLGNQDAVKKLFENVAPQFKERNGGYTRIIKKPLGRWSDNAPMAFIAFVKES